MDSLSDNKKIIKYYACDVFALKNNNYGYFAIDKPTNKKIPNEQTHFV